MLRGFSPRRDHGDWTQDCSGTCTLPRPAKTARAPGSYVRETFDSFAAGFEQRLVGELDYRVPAELAELVRRHGAAAAPMDVLDLGCGTGLVGDALGPLAAMLAGVDLSPRMLEEARAKGRYSALHEADIADWLAGAADACFDLVIAADVFIYIGELEQVFRHCARVLRRPARVFGRDLRRRALAVAGLGSLRPVRPLP
jgi:predicted TPR repeat methyltransferase